MTEQIKEIYNKYKQWINPLAVGVGVFITSQLLLVAFVDNPLPAVEQVEEVPASPSSDLEARVHIDRLGIDVPIVWSGSTDKEALEADLQRGAIRYPGTVEPGNAGNAFITAHSSDYPWNPGEYKQAFADLGKLEQGDDDIYVTYYKDGEPVQRAQFRVAFKEIVRADDTRMIEQTEKPEMTLVTCWPIGTAWRRLMVKTELVEIQNI